MSETLPSSDIVQYPLLPLRDVVVFPHMIIPFVIRRPSSIKALEYALVKGTRIFLSAQHDATRPAAGARRPATPPPSRPDGRRPSRRTAHPTRGPRDKQVSR